MSVGGNRFSPEAVTLVLPQLKGRIDYATPCVPWLARARELGITGWYEVVLFRECFHGIVSFGLELRGSLDVERAATSFDQACGYVEKDWGKAFPADYIWMASNHTDATTGDGRIVERAHASFTASVSTIA